MMPDLRAEVLLKVLQSIVENIRTNQNPDTRSGKVIDGMDVLETSHGLKGQDKPLK